MRRFCSKWELVEDYKGELKMSNEEKEYLKNYNISKYDRPSIATDIVVFTIDTQESEDTRQQPVRKLKVLLIKRASFPYKNLWALPGGFCRKNEEVFETARRELYEETNVRDAYLTLSGIYGEPDRDPRGWIISHAFMALTDGRSCVLRADTDAWEAKWFEVDIKASRLEKKCEKDEVYIKNQYLLRLTCDDEILSATVSEIKIYKNYHETASYEIVQNQGLAFDHAKIIVNAFRNLQTNAENDERRIFDLMPEQFTLTELQSVFEVILQKELVKPNFRRKIADFVIETQDMETGRRFRAAKQFRRNVERFFV